MRRNSIERHEIRRNTINKHQIPVLAPQPEIIVEEPDSPYVAQESIGKLLQAEPVEDRLESLKKHRLEFMSYLRPVLNETPKDGEGWEFLGEQVRENNEMFNKILDERIRREAIEKEV